MNKVLGVILSIAMSCATALVAVRVNIHNGSWCPHVWAFVDFFIWPLAWVKWILCHDVNLSIIKEALGWIVM